MAFLIVGDANADIVAPATHFPSEGDDLTVARLEWASGGSAANVAAGLALLGAQVQLLACVGTDPAAEVALQVVRETGVGLALLQHHPRVATGVCYALVSPNGERTFLSFRGANVELALPHEPLARVKWLHIAGHALLEGTQRATVLTLIEQATELNIPMSLDLCLPLVSRHADTVHSLLEQFQVLFGNTREIGELGVLADAPSELLRVTKRGEHGCVIQGRDLFAEIAGFPTRVVDTNGCGDAFVAAFLHTFAVGQAPEQCARIANAAGALAATRPGAAPSLPTREVLHNFLKSTNEEV